ncbi:MAG: hypothetical protein C4576_13315 [Desulfobacteraceae bacterium]|nr:MAG: hypothetical protein C4576_13315 [Desulfobacteraceae bacterium]
MERLAFEEWWQDFLAQFDRRADPYTIIDRLRTYFRRLSDDESADFEQGLVDVVCSRGTAWSIAEAVLEDNPRTDTCSRVAAVLREFMPSSIEDQSYEAEIVRILARCRNASAQSLVREFLLDKPIRMYWTSVPWSVWPQYPDLFGQAYVRYFENVDLERIRGTAVIQAFFFSPEALKQIKIAMLQTDKQDLWKRLRQVVLQTRAVGVSESEISAVQQILAEDS